MSALAAIFRRDGDRISERTLAAIVERLRHRGPDGDDRWIEGAVGLAHLHRWVTPEEVGERQPVQAGDRVLVFDGRLDNRGELISMLGLGGGAAGASDAELVLAAHEAWGGGCCARLVGPFALALHDQSTGRGLIARDALGDRTLFYADLGDEFVVASEEASLLAHPRVSDALDDTRMVAYFGGEVPADGSTFFEDVRELAPGCLLRIGADAAGPERFWSPPAATAPGTDDEGELAERYRELLGLAVSSRLRSPHPAAVLMSGGLDSTSLAALATENGAARGEDGAVRAVSWVFDSLPECDERAYIGPVVDRLGLASRLVVADRLTPTPDCEELCVNPAGPEESPYRRLKAGAYRVASEWGSSALLTGGSADALYAGFERWAIDLIRSGRPVRALAEVLADVGQFGVRTGLRRAGLGRAASRRAPRWMTPGAGERWREAVSGTGSDRNRRQNAVAGPRAARSISLEVFHAARCGVDLRHPYRDLRLVEFMLSLPAYHLYRQGRFKVLARHALAGRLPESVLGRTQPTLLTPLFERALRGENRQAWRRLLDASDAVWPRYVRRDWIEAALERSAGPAGDVALWNCVAFELWWRRFSR